MMLVSSYEITPHLHFAHCVIDAGPFGGCVPVQMDSGNATAAPAKRLARSFSS
jgi:hypothetical protein